jgi:putative transcriptional regulator
MAVYFRLKALIEHKEATERRKITYRDIASEAKVSTNTLTQMANQNMNQIGLVTLEKLCAYFDCQVGDLMVYVPAKEQPKTN